MIRTQSIGDFFDETVQGTGIPNNVCYSYIPLVEFNNGSPVISSYRSDLVTYSVLKDEKSDFQLTRIGDFGKELQSNEKIYYNNARSYDNFVFPIISGYRYNSGTNNYYQNVILQTQANGERNKFVVQYNFSGGDIYSRIVTVDPLVRGTSQSGGVTNWTQQSFCKYNQNIQQSAYNTLNNINSFCYQSNGAGYIHAYQGHIAYEQINAKSYTYIATIANWSKFGNLTTSSSHNDIVNALNIKSNTGVSYTSVKDITNVFDMVTVRGGNILNTGTKSNIKVEYNGNVWTLSEVHNNMALNSSNNKLFGVPYAYSLTLATSDPTTFCVCRAVQYYNLSDIAKISSISNSITILNNELFNISENLSIEQTTNVAQDAEIESIKTSITALNNSVSVLTTKAAESGANISYNKSSITALNNSISTINNNISTINNNLTSYKTSITALQDTTKTLTSQAADAISGIVKLNNSYEQLYSTVTFDNKTLYSTLSPKVYANEENISNIKDDLITYNASISALEKSVSTINNNYTILNTQVSENSSYIKAEQFKVFNIGELAYNDKNPSISYTLQQSYIGERKSYTATIIPMMYWDNPQYINKFHYTNIIVQTLNGGKANQWLFSYNGGIYTRELTGISSDGVVIVGDWQRMYMLTYDQLKKLESL